MDPGTWIAVCLAALSMIGTAVAGTLAAVVKIAQIRADAKTVALETQNAAQAKQIAGCEEKHQACEEKHATLSADVAGVKTMIAELQKK